jgi:hypothetical protein
VCVEHDDAESTIRVRVSNSLTAHLLDVVSRVRRLDGELHRDARLQGARCLSLEWPRTSNARHRVPVVARLGDDGINDGTSGSCATDCTAAIP